MQVDRVISWSPYWATTPVSYQEAVAILERIPKDVLDAYTHMGTTERNPPMKQGL